MALVRRASLTVAIPVVLIAAACSTSIAPSATSVASPTAPAGSSTSGPKSAAGGPIPRLLAFDSTGVSVVEIDPNIGGRIPLVLPAGRWTLTTGASTVALSSLDRSKPTHIGIVRLAGTQHLIADELTLPGGDAWLGAYAACISPGGRIVAADAGLSLYVLHPVAPPDAVPGQTNNLGHCTWLDETHLLWDEEGDRMAVWDSATGTATQLDRPSGREPSAGGSRLAWTDRAGGTLFVSEFAIDLDGVVLGNELGSLSTGAGSISDEGRWLVAPGPVVGTATVYDLSGGALVPVARVSLRPGEHARWLPTRQS
jgi:hypothetical protein